MTAGSVDALRIDMIVAERAGVLTLARSQSLAALAQADAGRITVDDATLIGRTLRSFADMVATGLHRDEDELPEVRARLRVILQTAEVPKP